MKSIKNTNSPAAYLLFKFTFCVTSVVICFVGFVTAYGYLESTPKKFEVENYRSYVPHVLRGASEKSNLKTFYVDGKRDSVISGFNTLSSRQPEDYLLAGISYLEKKEPKKAIEILSALIQINQLKNTDDFERDAEYYLAMSYMKNEQPEKAMPLLEKIQADPENPYYDTVSEMPILQIRESLAKK